METFTDLCHINVRRRFAAGCMSFRREAYALKVVPMAAMAVTAAMLSLLQTRSFVPD